MKRSVYFLTAAGMLLLIHPVFAQSFKGKLDEANKKQTHPIKLEEGKIYRIDMTSSDFDTFLRIQDPTGQEVAKDDDGGGNLNSRLFFVPKKAGEYKLVAGSFIDEGRGDYTLQVQVFAKKAKPSQEKGKIDNNSALFLNKVPHQPFKLKLMAGKLYQIDLVSDDFDALLLVQKTGQEKVLAGDDDGGGGLNSRLFFTPTESGEYTIIAASLRPDGRGAFVLTTQELEPEKGGNK